jgi:hypothetical protein
MSILVIAQAAPEQEVFGLSKNLMAVADVSSAPGTPDARSDTAARAVTAAEGPRMPDVGQRAFPALAGALLFGLAAVLLLRMRGQPSAAHGLVIGQVRQPSRPSARRPTARVDGMPDAASD